MQVRAPREVPLSWFGKTIWKFYPLYIELILLAFCLRLIGIVEPFIFQVIIDRVLPFQREATLVVVITIFAISSVFQIVFSALAGILGVLTANRVTSELGGRLFEHLFRLPFRHFRGWAIGETIARMNETDTIRSFIVGATTGVILDLVFVFLYIAVLYTLSPNLTFIVIATLPIQALIYFSFGPFLRKRLKIQFDAGAMHQAKMVENISGIAAVKALSAEQSIIGRLNNTLSAVLLAGYRVHVLSLINSQLIFFVDRFLTLTIIFVGANLVFSGEMTLGQLIAFHLLASKVSGPISNFSQLWESWQNVRVSRQRLGDILGETTEPFGELPNLPRNTEPDLKLNDVSFSYLENLLVLDQFSFHAKAHSLTLVIGQSGTGKSTFGRLAAGIDRPSSGTVELGGLDISQYEPHSVRSTVAYVPQEPFLFSGTLRDNLVTGAKDYSDEELHHVLDLVSALEVLEQLPFGLETQVGERGSALSGGQRQRVAIARSLLLDPKVIILDEPTSALDDENQKVLVRQLSKLKEKMTIIVITHRPDVFEKADQIVNFEKLA